MPQPKNLFDELDKAPNPLDVSWPGYWELVETYERHEAEEEALWAQDEARRFDEREAD